MRTVRVKVTDEVKLPTPTLSFGRSAAVAGNIHEASQRLELVLPAVFGSCGLAALQMDICQCKCKIPRHPNNRRVDLANGNGCVPHLVRRQPDDLRTTDSHSISPRIRSVEVQLRVPRDLQIRRSGATENKKLPILRISSNELLKYNTSKGTGQYAGRRTRHSMR